MNDDGTGQTRLTVLTLTLLNLGQEVRTPPAGRLRGAFLNN
jgi:hypothetical protein